MFERFTERARRVLFFARYEASELGSTSIELEHLLLGLLREEQRTTGQVLVGLPLDRVRSEIAAETVIGVRVSKNAVIPFSTETKRALESAAEESRDLRHSYIGTEHLLLGILRQKGSRAADLLARHGVTLMTARSRIVELLKEDPHLEGRPITSVGPISFDLSCPPVRQIHNTVTMLRHIVACLEHSTGKGDGDEAARAQLTRLIDGLKGVVDGCLKSAPPVLLTRDAGIDRSCSDRVTGASQLVAECRAVGRTSSHPAPVPGAALAGSRPSEVPQKP